MKARVTAAAFLALFSVVGLALYGLPLYYDFMVREFGWSRTVVTSGNAISKLIVGPAFGLAAGWIVDRFGPRRLMLAGLTDAFGWRASLQILGALIVVLAAPLVFVVPERREERAAAPAKGGERKAPLGDILRTRAFYALAVGSMCSIAAVGGANQHLKLFLSLDRGYSQGDAARIISLVLTFSIAGRLLMGWLADHLSPKHVMLIVYALVAVSIPILRAASTPAATLAFSVVFGLGLGGEYLIIPLVAAELFGVRVLGRVMGIILTADGIAEATAPMLVGYLRDVRGNYDAAFLVLVAAALVGAFAIATLPARPVGGVVRSVHL